jgi:hypothetical protein
MYNPPINKRIEFNLLKLVIIKTFPYKSMSTDKIIGFGEKPIVNCKLKKFGNYGLRLTIMVPLGLFYLFL